MRKINDKKASKLYGGNIPTIPPITNYKKVIVVPYTPKPATPIVVFHSTGHAR